ncbi:fibronectin type III-like domain-contianing protein, partial [Klebsiella aerogenes]
AHARVTLDPGERKVVTLAIPHAELALVAADGQWRVEPGAFDLWVDAGGVELHSQFDAV